MYWSFGAVVAGEFRKQETKESAFCNPERCRQAVELFWKLDLIAKRVCICFPGFPVSQAMAEAKRAVKFGEAKTVDEKLHLITRNLAESEHTS